jgi:N-methylhydantoinase A
MPASPYVIGIDTGGTFTDLVRIDRDGRLDFDKTFSTPDAPENAVFDVLRGLAARDSAGLGDLLGRTGRFGHGTTVSTNALIQRRGARVGLITTRGFEDTLIIARGPVGRAGGLPQKLAMDFLHTEPPEPLVPKALTRGVGERVTASGEELAPVDPDEARRAIMELLELGIESLAVCLLWSFRDPAHEREIGRIAAEIAPDLRISLSCDVAPRMGEFERAMTTVINAYIGPLTERYVSALQTGLAAEGLEQPIQVMKASGGVALPSGVANQAVSVVNSGPIGGLVAARHLGGLLGYDNVITADMGGTSFDVGLVSGGVFEEEAQPFLDQGLPVLSPSVKVITIGAGGGSIASTDGHRLAVGPESAGARPGPACYGQGGIAPTVTDALVALGIIDPNNFFGGRYTLDAGLALAAIETEIARPLGLEVMEAAAGIYEIVTSRMADLIRKVSIESGNDPRDFCLFAYGGASGAHCAEFAARLGIEKVVVPYAAPVFSALGIALTDLQYAHVRSEPAALNDAPETLAAVNAAFADVEARARADLAASGHAPESAEMRYRIDMRYRGQMNEVSLPWPEGRLDAGSVDQLRDAFEIHYQRRFGAGTIRRETPLELISFRAEAVLATDKPRFAVLERNGGAMPEHRRKVYRRGDGWLDASVIDFDLLAPAVAVDGPAVIERDNTTIWLPPGASGALDEYGNLEIRTGTKP